MFLHYQFLSSKYHNKLTWHVFISIDSDVSVYFAFE